MRHIANNIIYITALLLTCFIVYVTFAEPQPLSNGMSNYQEVIQDEATLDSDISVYITGQNLVIEEYLTGTCEVTNEVGYELN